MAVTVHAGAEANEPEDPARCANGGPVVAPADAADLADAAAADADAGQAWRGLRPGRRPPLPPPVTGAWAAGMPIGQRRFARVMTDRPIALEGGGHLRDVTVAYETWGSLASDASNAVLVCHALTGDAHAAGAIGPGHPTEGWWDDLIGPGKAIDTNQYFVVCSNVLGGCQGTTGPASPDPETGRPFGSRFPVVSIRDMVRVQAALADAIGVGAWRAVIGGSMGGMQVLEWGVMLPRRVRCLIPIASTAAASAQQIAWSAVGRQAIALDPNWRGGDYYDAPPGGGPHAGLALARQIAQIHYRSETVFAERFGRRPADTLLPFGLWGRFEVESYLDYHGDKLVRRFDANTYLALNKAMDLHDLGRGRGGAAAALARISAPTLTMTVTSDTLYPPYQQYEVRDTLAANGVRVEHVEIQSPDGHDGFLLEPGQIGPAVARFLQDAPAG